MTESEAQVVDTNQIQLEMVIKRSNCWSFINLWIFSCQTKNKKYYYVVISRSIFGFTFLAILNNSTIIELYDDKFWKSYQF